MEEKKSNAGLGLGIAGLVLGIIALLIAFIPCIGLYALVPGGIAIVLSAVALMQARKANASKGLIIAALVISILGTTIAALWGLVFASAFTGLKSIKAQIETSMDKQVVQDIDNSLKSFEAGKPVSDADFDKFLSSYEKFITEAVKLKEKSKEGDLGSIAAFATVTVKLTEIVTKLSEAKANLTEIQIQKLDELNQKFEKDLETLKQ